MVRRLPPLRGRRARAAIARARAAEALDARKDDLGLDGGWEGDAAAALLAAHERLDALLGLRTFPEAERHVTAVTLHVVTEALRRGGWLQPPEDDDG